MTHRPAHERSDADATRTPSAPESPRPSGLEPDDWAGVIYVACLVLMVAIICIAAVHQ